MRCCVFVALDSRFLLCSPRAMQMGRQTIREFRLAPSGSGRGVSCSTDGAFSGAIPLLQRNGEGRWEPRDCAQLSKQIGADFGLPIDMSAKMGGLRAICNALNEGDVTRAQVATVLLAIPERPAQATRGEARGQMLKFIGDLDWSGLIKGNWNPTEHPRWSAGSPDSQGGRFAPKEADDFSSSPSDSSTGDERSAASISVAATWPSNGPPDQAAVCARFARLCVLLAPFILSGDTPQYVPLHDHHIFPQQFRKYFEQRGIDIDQYTVTMDGPTHLEGVHGSGVGEMPGQWNKAWADFIAKNPAATRQQIFDFAGQLMKRYGISSSEIHPYGKLP